MTSISNVHANIEKVEKILSDIAHGKRREDIAMELGYTNPKSMDIYMRRKGFFYNRDIGNYEPSKTSKIADSAVVSSSKMIENVIAAFMKKDAEPRKVAQQNGFDSYIELAEYMKEHGFAWDDEVGNYRLEQNEIIDFENMDLQSYLSELSLYLPFLRRLYELKDELLGLVSDRSVAFEGFDEFGESNDKLHIISINEELYVKLENIAKKNSIDINSAIAQLINEYNL